MSELDALVGPLRPEPAKAGSDGAAPAAEVARSGAAAQAACAPNAPPFKLSRCTVSADELEMSRRLGRGCAIRLPALGRDTVLSLQPLQGRPKRVPDQVAPITLSGAFGALTLNDGARLLRALGGIDLGAELSADDERWAWLQAAVVGRLAATPFAAAERVVRSASPPEGGAIAVRIGLSSPDHAFTTLAHGSAASWLALLRQQGWTRQRLPVASYLALPVIAEVRIARHTLPAGALHGVEAGDLILPDSPRFSCDGVGSVAIGTMLATVRYRAPCTLEVLAVEEKLDSEDLTENLQDTFDDDLMPPGAAPVENDAVQADNTAAAVAEEAALADGEADDNETQAAEAPDDSALDAVPVAIDFVLGKLRIPLGELRSLGAGSILTLEGGSPSSIAIVSAGRVLGRGEAVDVNGRLAIRVVEWGRG